MSDLAALLDKEAGAEITAILSEARDRASEIVAAAQAEAETLLASRERAAQVLYEEISSPGEHRHRTITLTPTLFPRTSSTAV